MATTIRDLPTERTQLQGIKTEPNDCSNDNHEEHKNLYQILDTPEDSSKGYFTRSKRRLTENAIQNSHPMPRNFNTPIASKAKPALIHSKYLPSFVTESPLIVSPTESLSAASSPGTDNEIWDLPETPSHSPIRKSGVEVLTPLTPDLTEQISKEQSPSPTTSRSLLAKSVKGATIFDKIAAQVDDLSDDKTTQDISIKSEDNFRPKKLFRGFTAKIRSSKLWSLKTTSVNISNDRIIS